jgi:urease accessory protein UreF
LERFKSAWQGRRTAGAAVQDITQETTQDTRKRGRPKSETEVPPSGCALYSAPDLERRFACMSFSHTHLKLTMSAAIRSPPLGQPTRSAGEDGCIAALRDNQLSPNTRLKIVSTCLK